MFTAGFCTRTWPSCARFDKRFGLGRSSNGFRAGAAAAAGTVEAGGAAAGVVWWDGMGQMKIKYFFFGEIVRIRIELGDHR